MHCVDACIADMSMQMNNVHNGVMFDFYPGLPHDIKDRSLQQSIIHTECDFNSVLAISPVLLYLATEYGCPCPQDTGDNKTPIHFSGYETSHSSVFH